MGKYIFDEIFEKKFIQICECAASLNKAANELKMNYKTVCFHAKRLGCFKTNQAGKGVDKKQKVGVILLEDIFSGKYTYQTHKLKNRLLNEGLKLMQCESCLNTKWLDNPIPLELHHKDGNKFNNSFDNLQILCPNCHALTSNYRAKNIKNLSALQEIANVESLNVGETLTAQADGNTEPSSTS
jgi:5-methylcytosine-specific restriction endonuclease McrA